MSYNYMHMSDIKSLGVGHNVRHDTFSETLTVRQPHAAAFLFITILNK